MNLHRNSTPVLRPLILAGGLGSRLRPRTQVLPKPLLPVAGRPLLWYALHSVDDPNLATPIVALDYLGKLISTYFEDVPVIFRDLPGRTMAEAVLEIAEVDESDAFLGMSSDVLVPARAVRKILDLYQQSGMQDTVMFVRLPQPGHKKWDFRIDDGLLKQIEVRDTRTNFERVLLILNKSSLISVRKLLPSPVREDNLPTELGGFQCGWILLLRTLLELKIPIAAEVVDCPVCNINVRADFEIAEQFVIHEMSR